MPARPAAVVTARLRASARVSTTLGSTFTSALGLAAAVGPCTGDLMSVNPASRLVLISRGAEQETLNQSNKYLICLHTQKLETTQVRQSWSHFKTCAEGR